MLPSIDLIFPLCPNMVKNFCACYKPENFHVKWFKHADFNGTIFENVGNIGAMA